MLVVRLGNLGVEKAKKQGFDWQQGCVWGGGCPIPSILAPQFLLLFPTSPYFTPFPPPPQLPPISPHFAPFLPILPDAVDIMGTLPSTWSGYF